MSEFSQQIALIRARYSKAGEPFHNKLAELAAAQTKEIAAIQEHCGKVGHRWKHSGHEDLGQYCLECGVVEGYVGF